MMAISTTENESRWKARVSSSLKLAVLTGKKTGILESRDVLIAECCCFSMRAVADCCSLESLYIPSLRLNRAGVCNGVIYGIVNRAASQGALSAACLRQ